jgi:hypothetical protein
MLRRLTLVSGIVTAANLLIPQLASGAVVVSHSRSASVAEGGSAIVQKAQWYADDWRYRRYRGYEEDYDWRYRQRYEYGRFGYYSRCHYWRQECARRWGWGGWEYRRCLRDHGCGGGNHNYRY